MFGYAHAQVRVERTGWDPMCKYSYLSGACANRRVNSLQCVGENECDFSGMNILGIPHGRDDAGDSEANRWLELYCETHGTFLCRKGVDCAAPPARTDRPTTQLQRTLDEETRSW